MSTKNKDLSNILSSKKIEFLTIKGGKTYAKFINEYWTSKQRQASSLHEISYRACFKPQLPRFFIETLSYPGDLVYDPFVGRGTTMIEAALLGRRVVANDINPLSRILTVPRLFIPSLDDIENRLNEIKFSNLLPDIDLSMFYHEGTISEIMSLKRYLERKFIKGEEDIVDQWIRMVATNRLTGHSDGFFSVYTLPPNQAVTPERQKKINERRNQVPQYKAIKPRILKKAKSLLRNVSDVEIENLTRAQQEYMYFMCDARHVPGISDNSVQLTVTSPPFLNITNYINDNWLRCWFNNINIANVDRRITMSTSLDAWKTIMRDVFKELYRITKPGGWVAFEGGEIKKGEIELDREVIPLGVDAGLRCKGVLINLQYFTKTSNIWGVDNNLKGTNTNRIVIFMKE
jgi:hypothetical protein